MKHLIAVLSLLLFSSTIILAQKATPDIATKTKGMKAYDGFFKYYWDEAQGKIWLEIKDFDKEFLHVNSLSAGVGSNDLGLDRNQLGGTRVVAFKRVGPKVLLIQPNYDYRAVSDNPDERESVADAFARSVIWGAKVEAVEDGRVLVDLSSLLMADAHNIAEVANSKSVDSKIIAGSLPPNSRKAGINCLAASSATFLPVATLPVKQIKSTDSINAFPVLPAPSI